jgi:hypothetical protein
MTRYKRLGAALMLMLGVAGCDYVQPRLAQLGLNLPGVPAWPAMLACHGDFAQFANGFMVTRPMELDFIVDWQAPWVVPTNGGSTGRILSLTALEFSFEVQYEGYRAAYHLNRVDGTFSQRPDLGGVFFGRCDTRPYTAKL